MIKLRYIISEIIGWVLNTFFKPKQKNKGILSIYFHNPPIKLFEKCIQCISKKGYRFIAIDELLTIYKTQNNLNEKLALITFDDGWQGNLKLVPILEKYKVYCTFFIVTEAIENGNFWWEYVKYSAKKKSIESLKKIDNQNRNELITKIKSTIKLKRSAMTRQELIEFSKNNYVTIGSHTVSHPITTKCGDDELENEFLTSKLTLEKWLNKPVNYFAFPNGDFNERDIKLLKNSGYKCAFSTQSDLITEASDIYKLPRRSVNSNGGIQENKAKMFGLWKKYIS